MHSKYHIIKVLKNCLQNINCFSWIKLILGPSYNSSWLKPLYNIILIMFFIGFPISSHLIRPHTSIEYTNRRVTRGEGRGWGLPCPSSKIGKKYPNLEKNCPDCGYLWVKFLIWNEIFKSFQDKKKKVEIFFLRDFFFSCFRSMFIDVP